LIDKPRLIALLNDYVVRPPDPKWQEDLADAIIALDDGPEQAKRSFNEQLDDAQVAVDRLRRQQAEQQLVDAQAAIDRLRRQRVEQAERVILAVNRAVREADAFRDQYNVRALARLYKEG
jgi:hypothetical protein